MRLRKVILLFFALFITKSYAQAPDWKWAKSASGNQPDETEDVVTDAYGNVYVTGQFDSYTISFGSTTLQNTVDASYAPAYSGDAFIAKYDPQGNMLWAQSFGQLDYDGGKALAVDVSGNVYLLGSFENTMTVGSITLTTGGLKNIFLIKFSPQGNVIWAKSGGGKSAECWAYALNVDNVGNAYLAGSYQGDSITFDNKTTKNQGGYDYFLAKYDASGNFIWTKAGGGTGNEWIRKSVLDSKGNIYLCGSFNSSSLNFGSSSLNTAGSNDILLLKFDKNGNDLWAKSFGGPYYDEAECIGINYRDQIYMAGEFQNTFTMGSTKLTAVSKNDIFIAGLDSGGNVKQVQSIGGSGDDWVRAMCADAHLNFYVAGDFTSPNIKFGKDSLTRIGSEDMFVTQFDSSCKEAWVKQLPGATAYSGIYGISADHFGNIAVGGAFTGTLNLGSYQLKDNAGTQPGDAFVAEIKGPINGISESAGHGFKVACFPNPTHNVFHIQSNALIQKAIVTDLTGKEVLRVNPESNAFKFDLNEPNGIYFLQLFSTGGFESLKLIKN